MADWVALVRKAREDSLRIYPLLANSSPERRARQDRIDVLALILEKNHYDAKAMAEFITLNRERAADAKS